MSDVFPRCFLPSTPGSFRCHLPVYLTFLASLAGSPYPTSLFISIVLPVQRRLHPLHCLYSNALLQVNMDSEDGELFIKVCPPHNNSATVNV